MTARFAKVVYARNPKTIYPATVTVATPAGSVKNAPRRMVAASLLQKTAENVAKHVPMAVRMVLPVV
jgi:hypothetical protein